MRLSNVWIGVFSEDFETQSTLEISELTNFGETLRCVVNLTQLEDLFVLGLRLILDGNSIVHGIRGSSCGLEAQHGASIRRFLPDDTHDDFRIRVELQSWTSNCKASYWKKSPALNSSTHRGNVQEAQQIDLCPEEAMQRNRLQNGETTIRCILPLSFQLLHRLLGNWQQSRNWIDSTQRKKGVESDPSRRRPGSNTRWDEHSAAPPGPHVQHLYLPASTNHETSNRMPEPRAHRKRQRHKIETYTRIIRLERRSTLIGSKSYLVKAAKVWNSLPQEIRTTDSISLFKERLKKLLLDKPDERLYFFWSAHEQCKLIKPRRHKVN